jgi:hypothetical protein
MANRRPAGSGFDLLSSLRSFEVFEKVQTDEHFSGFGAFGGSDEPVSAHGIDEFAVRSAIIRKPSPGSLKNNILCNNLES